MEGVGFLDLKITKLVLGRKNENCLMKICRDGVGCSLWEFVCSERVR